MSLEDTLRKAAGSGRLNYLSIAPSSDGKGWDVAYVDVKAKANVRHRAKDVVEAVYGAMGVKPSRAPANPPAAPPRGRSEDLI